MSSFDHHGEVARMGARIWAKQSNRRWWAMSATIYDGEALIIAVSGGKAGFKTEQQALDHCYDVTRERWLECAGDWKPMDKGQK